MRMAPAKRAKVATLRAAHCRRLVIVGPSRRALVRAAFRADPKLRGAAGRESGMQYLVATDSVHTTAAACDYLEDRLEGDSVAVVTVPGTETRDADDALNVANARLLGHAEITTERLTADGAPASGILAVANDCDADVIVVGAHAGTPESGPEMGSTARQVIESADVPVVVVPLSL
jgi:nucleotide-binding universal stress UspA family protein